MLHRLVTSARPTNQANRIDIKEQCSTASIPVRLRIEDVCMPERKLEGMAAPWVLVQEITQVCSRSMCRRYREQHCRPEILEPPRWAALTRGSLNDDQVTDL